MRRPLAAAALVVFAAGCGQAAQSAGIASVSGARPAAAPGGSPSPTASIDPREKGRLFAQCMRENGVDMPDPGANGGAVRVERRPGDAKMEKALEACQSKAGPGTRKPLDPAEQEKFRALARCMRENGIDMPDPDFSGGRVTIGGGDLKKINPRDAKFREAMETCRNKVGITGGPGR
ncbi:hypothetical protein [Rhizohabitans arisaemae]|uniref:hypothetical protein n=1 Tax=Rhizohabitans arisaemae TaxID=2720610 RepID=UPI0024B0D5AC|nr:hypothetical protein [Rhizohabitans arisaemae]